MLQVRVETVYAYVSRGLLASVRRGQRGSLFDPAVVDAFAAARGGARRATPPSWRGPVLDTRVSCVADGRLYYRGVDAAELAAAATFETAANWLWTGKAEPTEFHAQQEPRDAATAAAAALPAQAETMARLRVAVVAGATGDQSRYDRRADAVVTTARGLVATMVEALPASRRSRRGGVGRSIAQRLWSRLAGTPADPDLLACLNSALILLMDHDLAVSTVAARAAASARAHPYAVVATGLSAMEGPLHGTVSSYAHLVLQHVIAGDAAVVVAEHQKADRPVPGVGHPMYPEGDPRAIALLDMLGSCKQASSAVSAARRVAEASGNEPNVDLALAALSVAAGMPSDGGEVIFSIGRSVGWIAHALEEYAEAPLRFRGHGRYHGPRPPKPLPTAISAARSE